MEDRTEKLVRIQEILNDLDLNFKDESLVRDNKIYFDVENQHYRVRMPTVREYKVANQLRKQKEYELMETAKQYKKEDIKKMLKEKQGVDLDALEEEKDKLKEKIQEAFLNLAPLSSQETEAIEKYTSQINEFKHKFVAILTEITECYSGSIESQLEDYYIEYLGFLCCEKVVDADKDVWQKTWNSQTEFDNSHPALFNKTVENMTNLILHIIKK